MATTGVMLFKELKRGTLLFQEAHGVGGVSERAGTSAGGFGRPDHRLAVRPDHRPAVLTEFSAKILGGGLGRPISAGRTAAEFFGRGPPPSLTAVSFR